MVATYKGLLYSPKKSWRIESSVTSSVLGAWREGRQRVTQHGEWVGALTTGRTQPLLRCPVPLWIPSQLDLSAPKMYIWFQPEARSSAEQLGRPNNRQPTQHTLNTTANSRHGQDEFSRRSSRQRRRRQQQQQQQRQPRRPTLRAATLGHALGRRYGTLGLHQRAD